MVKSTGVLTSAISGCLFGIGIWLFISGAGHVEESDDWNFVDCLPFIGSFIAFFMFLLFDWDRLDAEDFEYTNSNVACIAKVLLFITIGIGAGSFIGAAMLMSNKWTEPGKTKWYGVAQLICCLMIVMSGLIFSVGRKLAGNDGGMW